MLNPGFVCETWVVFGNRSCHFGGACDGTFPSQLLALQNHFCYFLSREKAEKPARTRQTAPAQWGAVTASNLCVWFAMCKQCAACHRSLIGSVNRNFCEVLARHNRNPNDKKCGSWLQCNYPIKRQPICPACGMPSPHTRLGTHTVSSKQQRAMSGRCLP